MASKKRTTFNTWAAAGCLLAWSVALHAHSGLGPDDASDLESLTESANLVVHGTVIAVDYVNSTTEGEDIPYTRVTYQVKDTLRGRNQGDKLTLQFIGGADGKGDFLFVSGVPTFQEGDEDILFVRGNGEDDQCPLVHCEYGRFRIYQNRVYNTHGQPVRGLQGNHTIARGRRAPKFKTLKFPAPKFDDLIKTERAKAILEERGMSLEAARAEYAKSAPKEIEIILGLPEDRRPEDKAESDPLAEKAKREARGGGSGPSEKTIGAEPISKETFVAKVRGLERRAQRKPTVVRSARLGVPVESRRATTPAKPEAAPGAERRPPQANAEDEAEARALEEGGLNPVLKPKKTTRDH